MSTTQALICAGTISEPINNFACVLLPVLIEVQSNNFLPTYKSENQMDSYYIFLGQLSGTIPYYISITKKIQNLAYLQFSGARGN